jgi:hypothetical protein
MLSPTVMSAVQVFHPLWCWVWLASLWECCGLPSVKMWFNHVWGSMLWFEQWLEWWRWLIPSWHVVLKSAKDRILGVDTLGQHVPPYVRYGTAFLLITNTIRCVSCLDEWGLAWDFTQAHMVQEGSWYHVSTPGNLSTTSGAVVPRIYLGNHSKAWHTPVVNLCNGT